MGEDDSARHEYAQAAPRTMTFTTSTKNDAKQADAKRQAVSRQLAIARKILRRDALLLQSLADK